VLLPQRPSRSGQVGGLSRELPPRRHGRKVPATSPRKAFVRRMPTLDNEAVAESPPNPVADCRRWRP
jgi:hypothetical protein